MIDCMETPVMPGVIQQQLASQGIEQLKPAWIQLEADGESIQSIGGEWEVYFDTEPERGDSITDLCPELYGMLPMQQPFELPQMQRQPDHYTDIYALQHDHIDWLLLCDVTQHTLQLQQYQQVANELILLKEKMTRTLNQYVGHEVSERAINGMLQFDLAGERRPISTLFVDIRSFTSFNHNRDALEVMRTVNVYMNCMLQPILERSGLVDKLTGDGAMTVFGVLPSTQHHTLNAFVAAKDILTQVKALNHSRSQQQLIPLGVGIGIATGDAVLGIIGYHERRAFTAIGHEVNLAARLESNAKAGEILIDENTFIELKQPQGFSPITLELKGIGEVIAYSFKP